MRTGIAWRVIGTWCLLAGTMLLSVSTAGADELLDRAQQLLQRQQAGEAFRLLAARESERAGEVEYDYLLGVAALDAGELQFAVVAFERTIELRPNHAGARLDFARTLFALGSHELAKQEFERVLKSDPPPQAQAAATQYIAAIDAAERARRTQIAGYVEGNTGYDSNITSVTRNFAQGVAESFDTAAPVEPTGNSIKRSGSFRGVSIGVDALHNFDRELAVYGGVDYRRRWYGLHPDFNNDMLDLRGGVQYTVRQQHVLRPGIQHQRYRQQGASPDDPKTTNDRNLRGLVLDYRYQLSEHATVGAFVQKNEVRYPTSSTQDTRQTVYGLSALRGFPTSGSTVVAGSVFRAADAALSDLASGSNVGRDVTGLRLMAQRTLHPRFDVNAALGYSVRADRAAYARSTVIEMGRDRTTEWGLGFLWRLTRDTSVRGTWQSTANRSNIPLYTYDRSEALLSLRHDMR